MEFQEYFTINLRSNAWTGEPITRTKDSHPYSYEPFTVFGSRPDEGVVSQGVYSDRMYQQDYEKYNACCMEVFGNEGQYFDQRSPKGIEKFLQLYYNKPNLKLLWVVEDCNQASGYPLWYFSFTEEE